jgi:hypothetical protein
MIHTSLGWCINKDKCAACPGYYRSKIDTNVVDMCFCECHSKLKSLKEYEKLENDAWIGCLAVAGLGVIFLLGVIFAVVFL